MNTTDTAAPVGASIPAEVPAVGFTATKFHTDKGTLYETTLRASLDDEFRNGHATFSLTCNIYEKDERGRWVGAGGGCAHKHILAVFADSPDIATLRQLAALHLSDQSGVPMHGPENAFYWFAGMHADGLGEKYHGGSGSGAKSREECARILADSIRATPEQMAEIARRCPHNKTEMGHTLEALGFRAKWKAEAEEVTRWLESKHAGARNPVRFAYVATRDSWPALTPAQVAEIEDKRASGYYAPAAVEARRKAKVEAAREKRRQEAHAKHAETLAKADTELALDLVQIECDHPAAENVIYYRHTGTISGNWADHRAKWDAEGWAAFVKMAKQSHALAGLKYELKGGK